VNPGVKVPVGVASRSVDAGAGAQPIALSGSEFAMSRHRRSEACGARAAYYKGFDAAQDQAPFLPETLQDHRTRRTGDGTAVDAHEVVFNGKDGSGGSRIRATGFPPLLMIRSSLGAGAMLNGSPCEHRP